MQTRWLTRREFLKASAAAGTAGLLVSILDFGGWPVSHAATMNPPGGWNGGPGLARYRIDGLAKVTGQKIYARDFQPIDLPNWPTKYQHALVVCAPFVDHIFDGLDLDQLPKELQPIVTITAADLARDSIGIAEEDYPEGEYLVPAGKPPSYLGQAVAILLYDELTAYSRAKEQIVWVRSRLVHIVVILAGNLDDIGTAIAGCPRDGFLPASCLLDIVGSPPASKDQWDWWE
ncbi:MAG: twin-arginine translocation signal domain-containing protein [Methyloceanibacter sp.]|uniref:twin-arginine translocation signal domain-containing protein n=1 Tax=Methyloceanibacter sp. TaxID=1965321 RepID=UPI003D9B2BD3